MDVKKCADGAAAVYANLFYIQLVDGGRNVKLTFCEQAGEQLAVRASVLLSRENAEALADVAGEILNRSENGAV